MSVSARHPEYSAERIYDWTLSWDAYQGEAFVKQKGEFYLPKPSAYSRAGGHADNGAAAYAAYKDRASFPEILGPSVSAITGIIHAREIMVEVPAALEYLFEDADGMGKTLTDFHRDITRNLLVLGRYGVLADAPTDGGDPRLVGYDGRAIINWDQDFFVLDESGPVREGFSWSHEERYRVLIMRDGAYVQEIHAGGAVEEIQPSPRGGGSLDFVPFTVASASDLGADIETPPLIGVSRAAKEMYQLSADKRLQLYMTGQETMVAINGPAPKVIGAGVVHEMHGTEGLTPDLKIVGPSGVGIEAHERAIDRAEMAAVKAGARMFEKESGSQESGAARRLRFKSETANIQTVAQVSSSVLERALRHIAIMRGADEGQVTVSPPDDLLDAAIEPQQAMQLWQIVKEGGLSYETFYHRLQKGGLANPDREAADELSLILESQFEADGP